MTLLLEFSLLSLSSLYRPDSFYYINQVSVGHISLLMFCLRHNRQPIMCVCFVCIELTVSDSGQPNDHDMEESTDRSEEVQNVLFLSWSGMFYIYLKVSLFVFWDLINDL